MWEKDININEVKELRTKSTIYFGVGAIEKIENIIKSLKAKNIHKVIVVSGKNAYKLTGAWNYAKKALETNSVKFINYDKVSPNPTTHQVDEATKLAREFKAQAVIAIGGGSAIDTGKSVAILLEYPEKNATELYNYEFEAQKATPIVAVNLTHGTGTEANRFAVVTIPEKDFKPAIAYYLSYEFN
jgi:alcohol dehydrogenase